MDAVPLSALDLPLEVVVWRVRPKSPMSRPMPWPGHGLVVDLLDRVQNPCDICTTSNGRSRSFAVTKGCRKGGFHQGKRA
jgi:hypothetical protein